MKKSTTVLLTLLLLLALSLLTAACGRETPAQRPVETAPEALETVETTGDPGNGVFSCVFINPGKTSEEYWRMVTAFMEASAEDLDIDLEVLYAERDHIRMVALTQEVAQRPVKPDYLIVVNEKSMAPEMMRIAHEAGIRTFLILNDLTAEQKAEYGNPREKTQDWIGTFIPDNEEAGYLIARSLIQEAQRHHQGPLPMVAISGSRSTPAAVERERGLERALKEFPQVTLQQLTYGEWEEEKGYQQAKGLLERYPKTALVWAANDLMATGALKAAEEAGLKPGTDCFISGLNWSQPALDAIGQGRMVSTVGGHFMVGGWSLVLLYDYHHGIDFASTEGVDLAVKVFDVIDAGNLKQYLDTFGVQDWSRIDFRRFSKKTNPELTRYEFTLEAVLNQLE